MERADQQRACCTTQENSKNAAEKTENAEHADGQREQKRGESGKAGRVALSGIALGDMDVSAIHKKRGSVWEPGETIRSTRAI